MCRFINICLCPRPRGINGILQLVGYLSPYLPQPPKKFPRFKSLYLPVPNHFKNIRYRYHASFHTLICGMGALGTSSHSFMLRYSVFSTTASVITSIFNLSQTKDKVVHLALCAKTNSRVGLDPRQGFLCFAVLCVTFIFFYCLFLCRVFLYHKINNVF